MAIELDTSRLKLVQYSPAHYLALIEGHAIFEKCFGLPAADGLRDFIVSGDIPPEWIAALRASPEADYWKHGFAMVEKEAQMVIGNLGFKGPPDAEGVVEIAYGVVPDFEGKGYATEAAQAGVQFAFGNAGVRKVRAHTLPLANASTRVLTKCQFEFIGDVMDPDDGPVWRWERSA